MKLRKSNYNTNATCIKLQIFITKISRLVGIGKTGDKV